MKLDCQLRPYLDRSISLPPSRSDIPDGGIAAVLTGSREAELWLWKQNLSMCQELDVRADRELPVQDFPAWELERFRWQAVSRHHWREQLASIGWTSEAMDVLGLGCLTRTLWFMRPDLWAEYDKESDENRKNFSPQREVRPIDTVSVWWRCYVDASHSWRTSPSNRHKVGTGCPNCGKKGTSRREQAVFRALQQHLTSLTNPGHVPRSRQPSRRRLRAWRVDMLLPGAPEVVIEYDGAYWHRDLADKDVAKTADIAASGRVVVRVREAPLPALTNHDLVCPADMAADKVADLVLERLRELGIDLSPSPLRGAALSRTSVQASLW